MSYPIAIFWILLVAGLVSRGPLLLYVFFGAWAFGAFAAIPTELTAGVTLTPAWIAAVCIFGKIVLEEGPETVLRTLFDVRKVGLLTYCAIYGIISAFLFPRLFEGIVEVIPMRVGPMQKATGLTPTTANVTQTVYFLITVMTCAAAYLLCLRPNKLHQSINAMLFGGVVVIITGIADWATALAGVSNLLAPFRTATYSLLTDAEVLNAKRIVGLTPEASSFAGISLTFLAPILFLRNAYRTQFTRNVTVPVVVALLILMIYMSTSSSGFVGMIVLLLTAGAHWAWMATRGRGEATTALVVAYGGVVALLALIAIHPSLLELPVNLFTEVVLRKTTTSSFTERSMWNEVSLDAFVDSWGLGAGLGSARASSWPVSVLANIGVPGAVLLSAFLLHIAKARPLRPTDFNEIMTVGIKFGFVPGLVMMSMTQTSVNIGLSSAWVFGIIGALCWRPVRSSLVAPHSVARFHKAKPQQARARARALGLRASSDAAPGEAPDDGTTGRAPV